jgi:hypothetical protein
MLRVTSITASNRCHDKNKVRFESRRWLLHEFLFIKCSLTWTSLVVATGIKLLVSYHKDYNFMLRVTCITTSNRCHDKNKVRFESRRWLLHLLSSMMFCLTWTSLVVATGIKLLVSYHEDYNFMLQVTFVTDSNGWHDRINVSFENRNGLLHLLSFIMCSLTWTLLVVATGTVSL